jgi:cation diffusion facilitator family transporter
MGKKSRSSQVVWTALISDGVVTATKFIAASFSGSSVMLSEALHSLGDTSTQILLLAGRAFSLKPASQRHPFGYGKERFFWPLIVSFLIFSVGGVFSVLRGIEQIRHPRPLLHLEWNMVVFLVALGFDCVSWAVAWRELRRSSDKRIWEAIRDSKTPGVLAVFLEDTAGIVGVVVAGLGTVIVHWTKVWRIDGLSSLLIGTLLFGVAFIVAVKTKSLLIGESASSEVLQEIRDVIQSTKEVERLIDLLTMHLGPDEILINLDLEFKDDLTTDKIEATIDRIEQRIRAAVPAATKIFIEVETPPQKTRSPH